MDCETCVRILRQVNVQMFTTPKIITENLLLSEDDVTHHLEQHLMPERIVKQDTAELEKSNSDRNYQSATERACCGNHSKRLTY